MAASLIDTRRSNSHLQPRPPPAASGNIVLGWWWVVYNESVTETVTLWDDGETTGRLLRPLCGFRLAQPGEYARPGGSGAEESWLVALGEPEPRPWPREDGAWVGKFADLREAEPEIVRGFASTYGWLGARVALVPVAARESGPVVGESVTTWRIHSHIAAELLGLIDAADSLSDAKTAGEMHRRRVLEHFGFGPPGHRGPHWLGPDGQPPEPSRLTDGVTWEYAGTTVSPGDPGLLFHYGTRSLLVPFPVDRGPRFGMDLSRAPSSELAALARAGVAYALQDALRSETHGVLTLTLGLRVAPHSLLGAVYLGLARRLFRRKGQSRKCPGCGAWFPAQVGQQRYCTRECGDAHRHRLMRAGAPRATSRRKRQGRTVAVSEGHPAVAEGKA